MEAIHEGIFKSAEEAVTFACNYSSQQYAMSAMGKILQRGAQGSGRGLVGLDGAGQAGMVFAELERIDYWQLAVLVTGKLSRRERCDCTRSCCRGWKPNPVFEEAVSQLADHVARVHPVVLPVRSFRVAVIKKYFGEKDSDPMEVAKGEGMSKRTAERYVGLIREFIRNLEKDGITQLAERLDNIGMLVSTTA
ncbi:hypothetical protein C7401_13632 [Paraburkholderia unamae]|uniref:hypothetical protein n=1 Tax=Paraburkholderia unamae TaxID=219649 RepID=UPI000DC27339|nr:hypothetical protein [Paraburkholderia unamae]RAR51672.1 hypothetical protein C7401_13632 [Paraburkholderia unamae]